MNVRQSLLSVLSVAALLACPSAMGREPLWEIGVADDDTAELALAPNRYGAYGSDPFFIVGRSDPKTDWPYVHPGPSDAWAGGRPHTATILFGLKDAPEKGLCKLLFDLVDTHPNGPPRLRILVNGHPYERSLPPGGPGGEAALGGAPAKGKECRLRVTFKAKLLRAGDNQIDIINDRGSWLLYDRLALEVPKDLQLADVSVKKLWIGEMASPPVLVGAEDALKQAVQIPVRYFGDSGTATIRVGSETPVDVALTQGSQLLQIQIPQVAEEKTASVTLTVDGEVQAEREVMLRPVRKWTVYLQQHTHLDIGYTHHQSDVEKRQWEHFDTGINLARETANNPEGSRFIWLPEGFWAIDSFLREAPEAKRKEFLDAVRKGWVALDALYGNELTALCRPEELIELTACARRFQRDYGVTIDTAMITDVPGYTWGMVTVLAQSGVRYFSIGPNASHRIGYTLSDWGDKPFYWISPSGKERVLCWVAGKAYSWFHRGSIQEHRTMLDYLVQLDQDGFPYDIVPVRYSIGGDNGPPDSTLPGFVKRWNEAYTYPKLVIASTKEAFAAFEERYGDIVPEVRGDFTPYWEDGAGSSARETALNRAAAERIVQAQALWAMVQPEAYPAEEFHAAWREVILYDEHTWGAHNSISEPQSKFALDQWATKEAFALEAERMSKDLLSRAVAPLTGPTDNVESVLVFNTNPWPRSGLVILPADWRLAGDLVKSGAGESLPSQRLSTGELAFVAKKIPAMASARYSLLGDTPNHSAGVTATETGLANESLRLEVDPESGAIVRLQLLGMNHNFAAAGGLNTYHYVAGRAPDNPQSNGPVRISVKESGPVVASLLIESDAPGCHKLTREVRLVAGQDHAEIIDTLDKEEIYEKEGVHLGFAFDVPGGVLRMETPLAVVRPDTDQIKGACKNYFTVQRWVDVSNETRGVTWATLDAPLIEIGAITSDPRGIGVGWLRETQQPHTTFYSYVMNNYWETNYKAAQGGPTVFRYALRPHLALSQAQAQRFGTERSQPLIVAPAAENAAPSRSLLALEQEDIVVTTVKPSDDAKGLVIRLYNAGDKPADVYMVVGNEAPGATMWKSNFDEETLEKAPNRIALAPSELATYRQDPAPGSRAANSE